MKAKCLLCYSALTEQEEDYHAACSRKFFGHSQPPLLPYSENQLDQLAAKVVQSRIAVPGVQPKLSLDIAKGEGTGAARRLTIVGLWGGYILKPPSAVYPQLPEVEDLTMHLAALAYIKTVPHALIRLASGNLAYITRRIDRDKKKKIHMEDMCQLTGRLTENKYQGSYEQIAAAISKYSATPGLDVVNFYEMVLFSFITGNADMHLKNFSLIMQDALGMVLSPAYDLVATALVNPLDDEDLALTLNGKRKKINRSDFEKAFQNVGMDKRQQDNIFAKMIKAKPAWNEQIENSFLTDEFKRKFKELLTERFGRLL